MTTERERLNAWMQENGYSGLALSKKLGISSSLIYKMLNGTRPISATFIFAFGRQFGIDFALQMFGGAEREKWGASTKTDKHLHPEQYEARKAVGLAIIRGELLPAKAYKCHGCDRQAQQWHHESYHPDDHLCVVPLCRICHQRHHTGHTRLTFGVVPTSVGLIRIAVATP